MNVFWRQKELLSAFSNKLCQCVKQPERERESNEERFITDSEVDMAGIENLGLWPLLASQSQLLVIFGAFIMSSVMATVDLMKSLHTRARTYVRT